MNDDTQTITTIDLVEEEASRFYDNDLNRESAIMSFIADQTIMLATIDVSANVNIKTFRGKLKRLWSMLTTSTIETELFFDVYNTENLINELKSLQTRMMKRVEDDPQHSGVLWGVNKKHICVKNQTEPRFPSHGVMQIADHDNVISFRLHCRCGQDYHQMPFDIEMTQKGVIVEFCSKLRLHIHQQYDEPYWKYWLTKLGVCWKILTGKEIELSHCVVLDSYYHLQDLITTFELTIDKLRQRDEKGY